MPATVRVILQDFSKPTGNEEKIIHHSWKLILYLYLTVYTLLSILASFNLVILQI